MRLKKHSSLLLAAVLTLIFCLGCKKTDKILVENRSPKDMIVYTDLADTLVSFSGTKLVGIDITNDNVNDFLFGTDTSSFIFYGNHGIPSRISSNFCAVITLVPGDSIILPAFCYCSEVFPFGTVIKRNGGHCGTYAFIKGVKGFNTIFPNPVLWQSAVFMGDRYVGFQKIINGSKYFGWIRITGFGNLNNDLIIRDFAINMTPGNSIFCGQTQ